MSGQQQEISTKCAAVLGCGNLGGALVRGFRRKKGPREVRIFDRNREKVERLVRECGAFGAADAAEAAAGADIIVIAVKPKSVPAALQELTAALGERRPLVISADAGVPLSVFTGGLPNGIPCARAMPNAASRVGKGLTGVFTERDEQFELAEQLFSLVGLVSRVAAEAQLDAITGASASGQAFVCVMIEAMADGAVKMGIPRAEALRIAAQTVLGAGALVIEEGRHPADIKDEIATPGGTTIAGLHILESAGIRGSIVSAIEASTMTARKAKN